MYSVDCYSYLVLHQNNAPTHIKKEVKAWMASHLPEVLDPWPAWSPELTALDSVIWGIFALQVDNHMRRKSGSRLLCSQPSRNVMDFPRQRTPSSPRIEATSSTKRRGKWGLMWV